MSALPFALWASAEDRAVVMGRVSEAWRAAMQADPNMAEVVMVVELVLGDGTRHRMATQLVDTVNAAGERRDPAPVLLTEPSIANDYDIGNAAAKARSIEVTCPASFIRAQERILQGRPLAGFGEVSLLLPGMSWADRRVIMRGDMSGGVSFGPLRRTDAERADGRRTGTSYQEAGTFTCGLQDPRDSANPVFPPWVVEEGVTWSSPHSSGIGKPYPVVYGSSTVQGVRVSTSTSQPIFVVAYGHDWDCGTIWRNDVNETANFTVNYTSDANGVPVTVVVPTAAYFAWEDGDSVFAEVQALDPYERDPDLIDVLRDLLLRFHPAGAAIINDELFAAAQAKAAIDRRVGFHVNTQTNLLSFIEEGLLDDFPMLSMVWDGGRYGPVLTDYREPPIMTLELGTWQLHGRLGDAAETPKSDLFNDFLIRYGFHGQQDEFTQAVSRNPDNSPTCAVSASIGKRSHPVVSSVNIRSSRTATWVLDWMVSHLTLPTYFAQYQAAACMFWLLRRGDTVTLVDRDMLWFGVRCTVERITYQRGQVVLGLRVWNNPVRGLPWPAASLPE